ncbi:MAG: GNAT family N-acetyltransferase [archaeon]
MQKNEIKIRTMKKDDAQDLRNIWISPEVTKYTLSRPNLTTAQTRKRLMNPDSESIVALVENTPVGVARLTKFHGRRNHSGEIVMFISKDFQSKGIGTTLLNKVIQIAKKKKLKRVQLGVNVDNKKAIGLYKKMGFKIEGKLKKDSQRGNKLIDNYCMAKLF